MIVRAARDLVDAPVVDVRDEQAGRVRAEVDDADAHGFEATLEPQAAALES